MPPPPPVEAPELSPSDQRNARWGLGLFALYTSAYLAFVLVNTFWPAQMDRVVGWGLNLAVVSGLALIAGAMILSMVYARLCRTGAEVN